MANLTFAQLQTLTKRTIVNRSDMDTEVNQAIDQAYLEAACARVTFLELDTLPSTFATVSGTRRYNFDTTILAAGSGRNILAVMSVRDTTNKRNLRKHSPVAFDNFDIATTGKPVWYAHWGNAIEFHPTPDGAYTVQIRFRLRPTKLSVASSVSVLPEEFDWAIVWKAGYILNTLIGNVEKAVFLKNMARDLIASIAGESEEEEQYYDFALAPDLTRRA